jgi:hypothetical protein
MSNDMRKLMESTDELFSEADVTHLPHPLWDAPFEYQGYTLPPQIQGSLRRYVESGIPTGGFLRAVLSNDLIGAMSQADPENKANLPAIVAFIDNKLPGTCYGSEEAHQKWLDSGGLRGLY